MSDFEQKLLQGFVDRPPITPEEAAELVRIAEAVANWQQVSKALCDKENATLEEVLQAASQVKAELAAVKREKDALMLDFQTCVKRTRKVCSVCSNKNKPICNMCEGCDVFEWRGICPENTKEDK